MTVADLVKERFGELTPIQKLAIPRVLSGQNVLILAPTGSGKTEAALLPILEKIQGKSTGICALYITPLRALSRDLKQRFNWWCDRLQVSHDIRSGDTTQATRTKHRKNPPKILLTTVESLQALMMGKVMRKHMANIKFVIVDEVHDIVDNKRGAQLSMGLERLSEIADFKRIAISATVANESEAAKLVFGERAYALCEAGKNRKMAITTEKQSNERIGELSGKHRSLIFVNTRSTAEELGASLRKIGAPIAVHHGSLSKDVRLSTEDEFKSGKINSVICTSSLELGIDIGEVSLVMQYGSPHQVFRLIQRIGRSGHSMEKLPKGIIFTSDFDDFLESKVIAVFAENGFLEEKKVEKGAMDVVAHQLVGILLDRGRITLADAHNILSRSYAYGLSYDKLRMVALQLYGESILYYDETEKDIHLKAKPRAREYYYTFLSTIPKTKRFFMKDISSNKIISLLDEEFVVNLETGSSFLSQGKPWTVVDITQDAVLAEPVAASEIMVPSWTGEEIPVSFEVAREVGKMRSAKPTDPLPDDKKVIIEIIQDLIVVHACFGNKVNEGIARIFSKKLSDLLGESVWAIADPYRIMIKLPYPLKQEHIRKAFLSISNVKIQLLEVLGTSALLRFKFLHVGRMFGLLAEDANVSHRFISAMRYSVVYEETVRSIFFRYFDVPKTEEVLDLIRSRKMALVVDEREKPSFFAAIGISRLNSGESVGAFEPRERIVSAFRENVLSKTLSLACTGCGATRFMHLAGAPDEIRCHKCNKKTLGIKGDDLEFTAALINAYGKKALIALATYGVGPQTADRILRKLHRSEESFILELLGAQKNFIKNKKYWKL
ncbi:DEAD/DEAH box helicase [Candidatus Micrarchaeota archaeon]|nr:DEAD/DEAH box helicase [Candidatus Micrarchaeota archaeon]